MAGELVLKKYLPERFGRLAARRLSGASDRPARWESRRRIEPMVGSFFFKLLLGFARLGSTFKPFDCVRLEAGWHPAGGLCLGFVGAFHFILN
jgi:hypothetical protein